MIAFPNIKINLGLSITEKRPDGYHNLETVFYPVALEGARKSLMSCELTVNTRRTWSPLTTTSAASATKRTLSAIKVNHLFYGLFFFFYP